jgi:steroid delta-isomerase-like uncharacterized protein
MSISDACAIASPVDRISYGLSPPSVFWVTGCGKCHRGTAQALYNSSEISLEKEIPAMQDNSTIIRHFIEETINQGQIDSAVQFVWEDVVEQVPFPGQGPGLEGLKDILRGMRAGFPDLYFSVEEQIAEGDKVLTRFEWTGTHRGEFLGVPATGRSVKVWGMVIDRLQGGRIKDTRIIMDSLGLMMQLGVFPPPRA